MVPKSGWDHPSEAVDQGGFAGAVGADEGSNPARGDGKTDPRQGRETPEVFGQTGDVQEYAFRGIWHWFNFEFSVSVKNKALSPLCLLQATPGQAQAHQIHQAGNKPLGQKKKNQYQDGPMNEVKIGRQEF